MKLTLKLVSFSDHFFLFLFVMAEKRVWWISIGPFVLLDLQILGVVNKCWLLQRAFLPKALLTHGDTSLALRMRQKGLGLCNSQYLLMIPKICRSSRTKVSTEIHQTLFQPPQTKTEKVVWERGYTETWPSTDVSRFDSYIKGSAL